MLQRYKKNRTSASFLLTKCATFLIKCYWGTFSVPSLKGIALLYCALKDLQLDLDTYKTTFYTLRRDVLNYLASKESMYSQYITTAKQESISVPTRLYLQRIVNRIHIRLFRVWSPCSWSCKMLSVLIKIFSKVLQLLNITVTTESDSPTEETEEQ